MKQLDFIKANGEVVEKEAIHQWLDRSVKYITNGAYSLTLTRVVKRRSLQQNRLMWMWFKCVELELGQPSQDIHDYYCKKFFSREIANPVTGEVETVYSGTRGLNTAQMSDFLDKVQSDVATELGITLPSPDDIGYDEFRLQYERYV